MVEKRIEDDEEESELHYDVGFNYLSSSTGTQTNPESDDENGDDYVDAADLEVDMQEAEVNHRKKVLDATKAAGNYMYDKGVADNLERITILPQLMRVAQRRWQHLYDKDEHIRLRGAIVTELSKSASAYHHQEQEQED